MTNLLTVSDVAARLKLTPYTVRTYLRRGAINGIKLPSGAWRIEPAELEEFTA